MRRWNVAKRGRLVLDARQKAKIKVERVDAKDAKKSAEKDAEQSVHANVKIPGHRAVARVEPPRVIASD